MNVSELGIVQTMKTGDSPELMASSKNPNCMLEIWLRDHVSKNKVRNQREDS